VSLRALLLCLAGLGSAHAAVVDRIAAVVNDEVVTLSEVYELGREFIAQRTEAAPEDANARRSAELEVLDSIIRRRLIGQEMKRLQLQVTPVEVDRAIDDVARRHGVERDAIRSEVERSGVSWTQYRAEIEESIRDQKFTQAIIRPRITENEDEIRDAYRRMADGADAPKMVELGALFLAYPAGADEKAKAAVVAKAKAAKARVVKGEPFSKVSAELDQSNYGKNGGAMGSYQQGELVEILDKPAFAVPVGEVSDPIDSPQGVFLLEIRSRKNVPLKAYDEVRDEIAAQVYRGHIAREKDAWYQQARRAAAVEIKLPSQ
jgi:peptidyl-prolyl cis-trans isomerase SurA